MDEIYTKTLLFDFYGDLLTDHQKNIYQAVVMEDCSLSEVAAEQGISRQGVHDLIKRINKTLNDYESRLHLVNRFLTIKDKVSTISELTEDPQITKLTDEILEML
ncbi:MAG: DNA-binding protein [Lachnospiraceae bacterium]|nr:DNA-binding protein [Candidatus Equihabitans merdae]